MMNDDEEGWEEEDLGDTSLVGTFEEYKPCRASPRHKVSQLVIHRMEW